MKKTRDRKISNIKEVPDVKAKKAKAKAKVKVKPTAKKVEDNIDYPSEVIDRKAWHDYIQLQGQLENTKNRYFQTSDIRLVIDLCTGTEIIARMTSHLSQDEQNRIIAAGSPFRSHIRTISHLKRRALGRLQEKDDASEFSKLTIKQTEIIELFGKFYSVKDVHSIIIKDWGYDVTRGEVQNFYKRNKDKIDQIQKEYESKGHTSIRLTKRRSRLEELTFMYEKSKEKYIQHEADSTIKIMKELLESIKKEVDGDLVINGKMKLEIEETVNQQVFNDIMRDFNITALIIARVAGKLNVNPLFLISRLSNSIYARFSGFASPELSREEDEIGYPSQITYEMDRIREMYEISHKQDTQNKELPEVIHLKTNLTLKEQLMAKMRERQSHLDETTDFLNDAENRAPKS